MEQNKGIRKAYTLAKIKYFKAVRLESSIYSLYIFLEEHEEASRGTEREDIFITLSLWITTFNLLLEQNRAEWKEIVEQLETIGGIDSIDQWLEARRGLLEPALWNNFFDQY